MNVPEKGAILKPLTENELNANLDDKGKPVRLKLVEPGEFKKIPAAPVQTEREAGFKTGAKPEEAKPKAVQQTARKGPTIKPVAESQEMTVESQRMVELKADLKGAKELHLVMSPLGEDQFDWANWIEPQLIMKGGAVKSLTELNWKSAESAHGQVRKNQNLEGPPLKVDGKVFTSGLGAHAPSLISFDLPPDVEGFQTSVALDDGGALQGGQKRPASVKFQVFTQKPSAADEGDTLVPEGMFTIADQNLEIAVWATTPLLQNPTNIDFDAAGRLYVAEGVNYRHAGGRRPEGDRIVILEDTDGDGRADKADVFTQEKNLEAPLGVAVLEDKIIVAQPPDFLVYTDMNKDRKFDPAVDKREVLLTGFNQRQHDHSLHSLTVGPDGQWNFNNGNCGAVFTDKSGKTFRILSDYMGHPLAKPGDASDDGNIWVGGFSVRMNPDGTNARIVGHNYRNSYEQTLTSFGDLFQSDNDDPPACRVGEVIEGGNAGFSSADGRRSWGADRRPGQEVPTAQWRQEDPGTMPPGDVYGGGSPTGVAYYENGALGDQWEGLLLACEAGKNVIFGYLPKPEGAGFKLERFDFLTSNKEKQWAGSDFLGGRPNNELKTRFRPSDVTVGPDGALYVADWFDARVGGHGTMDKGGSGTIYRIAPKGFKSVVPRLDLNTTGGQIAALKSAAVNVRNSGFIRLKAQGAVAVPAVAKLLEDKNAHIAARAVWLLAQMGDKGQNLVKGLLSAKEDRTRLVALRALRATGTDMLQLAGKLAKDAAPMVRREIALALRGVSSKDAVTHLVSIAEGFDGKDRAYVEAFGLGSTGREAVVYDACRKAMADGVAPDQWSDAFAAIAWRLHPPQAVVDQKARALSPKLSAGQVKHSLTAIGFTPTGAAATAMIQLANAQEFAQKDLAQWWVNNRKGNLWKNHGIDDILKAMGQDPEKVQLTAMPMPPELANAQKITLEKVKKIKANVEPGKAAFASCYMCHKVGDAGAEYGPDLSTFGKQQTTYVLIDAILNPSVEISHGYEGTEITTKDGLIITGIVLSDADSVLIKSMGGNTQSVPKSRIAKMEKMKQSLMYPPGNLGLTPQMIADIVAFLKGQ